MVIRTIKGWLKDLFYNSTNDHLDNGRVLAVFALALFTGAVVWNMHLGKEINLTEFGGGLTAIIGALQVYVYHDRKSNGS